VLSTLPRHYRLDAGIVHGQQQFGTPRAMIGLIESVANEIAHILVVADDDAKFVHQQ
jgi:hypothetical protein